MINIETTNIDKTIARLKEKFKRTAGISKDIQRRTADIISMELKHHYIETSPIWKESAGTMAEIDGTDITIRQDGDDIIVAIGETTPKVKLKGYNGLPVEANPYLFVEYGFGIIGQDNPVTRAQQKGWQYNVKKHRGVWGYKDKYGNLHFSKGVEGANAIGAILSNMNEIVRRATNEVINGDNSTK